MKAIGPDDESPEGFSYDQDDPRFRTFRSGENIVAYTLEGNEIAVDWVSGRGIALMLKKIVDVDGREVVKISGFVSDKLEQAQGKVLSRFGNLVAQRLGREWKVEIERRAQRRYLVFTR